MRRVLITLAIVAGFALSAVPAMAQEGTDGSTEPATSSETSEPTQDPPSPPPPEDSPPPPEDTPTPDSESTPGGDQNPGSDQTPGNDQSPGGNQTPGANQAPGTGQTLGTGQTPEVDEVLEAGQSALAALVEIFAKPDEFKAFICHFPPGEPENVQFLEIGNPAVLAAHLQNHDGDFVATSASDCPGLDPEDPEGDRKVNICHFPPGEPENVQFIEISVNALQEHITQHGDFLADDESDCAGDPGEEDPKVTICHFPPGNPENVQFIEISVNALQMHLDQHGDFLADNEADCFDDGDDDDGDGDGDDGDGDGDGDDGDDDDKAAALPDTGGPSQWNLVLGVLLTVLGIAILSNRESMVRTGLFGPVPVSALSESGSSTIGRHSADLPATVVKPESHWGTWTALGAAVLVAVAIRGRRPTE